MQTHTKKCGKTFTNSVTLKDHQITHSNEIKHACNIQGCPKTFISFSDLKRHQLTHIRVKKLTPTGKKNHACNRYGKTFTLLSTQKNHQRIYPGEKN